VSPTTERAAVTDSAAEPCALADNCARRRWTTKLAIFTALSGIRPYVLAGAGLLRRDLDFNTLDSVSTNDFGYTLGGGVMGYFTDHVGLRGDVRYFRNFKVDEFDLDGVDFDKGTFNFGRNKTPPATRMKLAAHSICNAT